MTERTINPVSATESPEPAGVPADSHSGADPARVAGAGASESSGGDSGLPSFVATWRRAYIVVIAALAADVVMLWLLGRIGG